MGWEGHIRGQQHHYTLTKHCNIKIRLKLTTQLNEVVHNNTKK